MNDPAARPPAPYASPSPIPAERGVFADGARLRAAAFLYRDIELSEPFVGRLTYSAWWYVQRILINGRRVWWKVSWLTLEREIAFQLPADVDPGQRSCQLRIDFGPALRIRRFQLIVAGRFAYDEIR